MTKMLKGNMDQIKPVVNTPVQLPKLKKLDNNKKELPKLKLPKLTKQNG